MVLKEIIEKIKEDYVGHEDLDDMIEDLSNGDLSYWAGKLCEKDFPVNLKLAEELYKIEAEKYKSLNDYENLARDVDENGLKELAKSFYKKALENAEENYNDSISAGLIAMDKFNDNDLAKSFYKKALEKVDNDFFDIISLANEVQEIDDEEFLLKITQEAVKMAKDMYEPYLGRTVTHAKSIANINEEAAKEIFDLAKSYDTPEYLISAAEAVKEIYGEDEYAISYIQEIPNKLMEYNGEGMAYCCIYKFLKDTNQKRAEEFKNKNYDELKKESKMLGECDSYEELFGDESSADVDDIDSDDESSIDVDDIDFDDFEEGQKVLCIVEKFIFSKLEDMEAVTDDGDITEEGKELVQESIEEFIDIIREKFEGNIGSKILLSNEDGTLVDFETEFDKFNYNEFSSIYMVITKDIPQDDMNAIFLSIDEYEFSVNMPDYNDDIIYQSYSYGEYDSGIFSNGEEDCYINFNFNEEYAEKQQAIYKQAKEILTDE